MKLAAICIATALMFTSMANANEIEHPTIDPDKLADLYVQSDLIHCDETECINAITYEVVEWMPGAPGFTVVYKETTLTPDEFVVYEPYVQRFYAEIIADITSE